MTEGVSSNTGPIPPDSRGFSDSYKYPTAACGSQDGSSLKLNFLPGPLAPDPTLYPAYYSACPTNPAPRVRPNARDIFERGKSGTVGILLRFEGLSLHPESPSKKKVKDHEKENIRRLREIQKRCREKEMEKEQLGPKPVKALWKSHKYENVESKLNKQLQENVIISKPEAQKFLKAHSRCGSRMHFKRSLSQDPDGSKSTVDTEEQNCKVKDFIALNARNAKCTHIRRSRSLQNLNEVLEQKQLKQKEYDSKQKGHVPQYLLDLKEKWCMEKEKDKKQTSDQLLPPGHTIMPEAERLKTLNNIRGAQTQLTKELLGLPLRANTLSIQNRRTELEKKLSEMDEAVKIFSHPKVFIKIDS
ncbi:enkurin domain-containing protein 1 [Spea bombifrons]|uniref:enkurin domain-containing protein 1 n=1 Tax=Spea bombifrons TaxID=233779 RepID=UPI00234B3717|nr:enkurin domain-containing protein 1 [Spea bombifrons]XP_053305711.1 enkurin domain-containing protein 1 [Spea bombifrons]